MFELSKEKLLIIVTIVFDILFFILGIVAWYVTKDTKFFILSGLCISGSLSICVLMIGLSAKE